MIEKKKIGERGIDQHVCALVASSRRALEVAITKVVSMTGRTCAGMAFGLIDESTGSSGMSRRMEAAVMKNGDMARWLDELLIGKGDNGCGSRQS